MDAELQAIREARLAQLKGGNGGNASSGNNSNNNATGGSANVGSSVAAFLEAGALERLSRVALVRPDRATAVEQYVKQLVSTGHLTHKINEQEIIQILNGVAREQNKQTETKIIFDRKDKGVTMSAGTNSKNEQYDSEDDFFDE
ncbi:similar to Saccharomyces cerevisiae YMR074C Protein with homology to human PDCD5, which is involved in programmed cell death [Maudiozyma saulgeensis]|uniref:Similar to Saccharomyces cerevisiae YMR074C Protein with homology to human PDCD5, which is involved in programmed cell death n=1 Tax=Maudiozyma saulgeensis TaxID=1789683 RepID=A0A1X7R8L0_9SACH|nr:similar to Saccharomyces cerevisiae YMR074C Protein with homology to human PDCD5, which is involved in programmed cell death [Kazachstania saulgeensis]